MYELIATFVYERLAQEIGSENADRELIAEHDFTFLLISVICQRHAATPVLSLYLSALKPL